ncbi:MAG: linear amide C-N hydrolase [Bacteroidales bacterium]|nr:linear amide C-N hydrolase [Bacteroidales bacterium]
MKNLVNVSAIALCALSLGFVSCSDDDDPTPQPQPKNTYQFLQTQAHTAIVNWDPNDYDFEDGNNYYMEYYKKAAEEKEKEEGSIGCSSWRNGNFHGRNLDWYQANFGCLVIRMPKGGKVEHASVALLNGNKAVTHDFIEAGVLTAEQKKHLPCVVVDGINDAGVAVNINIVPHDPARIYHKNGEGDLSSQCVVRYLLDKADNVNEAIELLAARVVQQSIVKLAGDETHYMISDPTQTAVVEFIDKQMKVTYYNNMNGGFYSANGNPAIMTNLYDYAIEKYGLGNEAMFDEFPYGMGVERWGTIRDQYPNAAKNVEANLSIAQSVWYFDNFMVKRTPWYTENAVENACGKDANGWWYNPDLKGLVYKRAATHKECMENLYAELMPGYWKEYDETWGKYPDPHFEKNNYWETSHTVIYDVHKKVGYLYPFENRYASPEYPCIELKIP